MGGRQAEGGVCCLAPTISTEYMPAASQQPLQLPAATAIVVVGKWNQKKENPNCTVPRPLAFLFFFWRAPSVAQIRRHWCRPLFRFLFVRFLVFSFLYLVPVFFFGFYSLLVYSTALARAPVRELPVGLGPASTLTGPGYEHDAAGVACHMRRVRAVHSTLQACPLYELPCWQRAP